MLCSSQICHFLHKLAIRHFQLFPKFLLIFVLLFLKNFTPFKKHEIVLRVNGNQLCHTEAFQFLVLLFHL